MNLTFDSDHIQRLLDETDKAGGGRRGSFVQNYDVMFLKEDVSAERRLQIADDLEEGGISFEIDPETEIDPEKIPAGLWLVGDQGVYLMSNALERIEKVAYADEVNPERMDFDQWYDAKNAIFGGDDGVEFLPAETLRAGLNPGGQLVIDMTPDSISIEIPSIQDDGPSP